MKSVLKIIITLIIAVLLVSASYLAYIELVGEEKNNPPNEPIYLNPSNDTANVNIYADISWNGSDPDPDDNVTYDVYFGMTTPPPKVSSNQTTSTYDPGSLDYNTTYYWRIVAWDNKGASTSSPIWSFTTIESSSSEDNVPPSKVIGLSVTDAKDGKLDLEWDASTDNVAVDHYRIYRDDIYIADSSTTSYRDTGLTNGQSYTYTVSAVDTSGNEGEKSSPKFGIPTASGNQEYAHTVFIEEATTQWCDNCPAVADMLYDLYSSGNYRFYYVSLVYDQSDKAKQRLDEYSIYAFPTTFIDGGYDIIVGDQEKSVFEDKLKEAESRDVPKLNIDVNTTWNNETEELEVNVYIQNDEDSSYSGHLKVYLTEKISRWYDYEGVPYHFSLLDYIIDKDISISANGDDSESDTYDGSGLDPENLMIMAVIFNSESVEKSSYPSEQGHEFDAHYADATAVTEVVEGGNLPPEVGIEYPKKLRINLYNRSRFMTFLGKNTILIGKIFGKTTIRAYASDDSAIEKVELYIDDKLIGTVEDAPYEWSFRNIKFFKRIVRKHTISVTAYDDEGKNSTASIDVITFLL